MSGADYINAKCIRWVCKGAGVQDILPMTPAWITQDFLDCVCHTPVTQLHLRSQSPCWEFQKS